MTRLLSDAFERAGRLPEDEQDALALVLLDELEDNSLWLSGVAAVIDAYDEERGDGAFEEGYVARP